MSFVQLDQLIEKETFKGFVARAVHTGTMSFVFWTVQEGAEAPMHTHPHEQVAHVIEGRFELTVGEETKILEPGILAVIPPHTLHGGRALTTCTLLDVFYPEREDYKFS